MPRTKTAKSTLKPAGEVMLRELKKHVGQEDMGIWLLGDSESTRGKLTVVGDDGLVVLVFDGAPTFTHVDLISSFSPNSSSVD